MRKFSWVGANQPYGGQSKKMREEKEEAIIRPREKIIITKLKTFQVYWQPTDFNQKPLYIFISLELRK